MDNLKQPSQQGDKPVRGNKTARLELRLTPADKAAMEAKAKAAGHTPTEYVRRAALGLTLKERLPIELKQVLLATSKNLNQYLKLAHMGRLDGVDEAALGGIIQALNQALR